MVFRFGELHMFSSISCNAKRFKRDEEHEEKEQKRKKKNIGRTYRWEENYKLEKGGGGIGSMEKSVHFSLQLENLSLLNNVKQ